MELFEEALQKWEQALTIRQRDSASTSTPVPWDSKKQQDSMSENIPEVGPCFSFAFASWKHAERPARVLEAVIRRLKEEQIKGRVGPDCV